MHFEYVWMLHVLYTLLLSHNTMNKYITIAIPALTLIAILSLQLDCSHTHKNMARSRIPEMNWASENHEEALQLFKQTMSYYCEDEEMRTSQIQAK